MAFNPLSGFGASVTVAGNPMCFDTWTLDMKGNESDVTNFCGTGYKQWVPGIIEGTITLSGPLDEGNMNLEINGVYEIILFYSATVSLMVDNTLCNGIKIDTKVSDALRVSVTFLVNGVFSAIIS